MGVERRLRRLEGGHPLGDWCPDCGIWLGPIEEAEVEIVWWTGCDDEPEPEDPVICPTCLEPSHIVIRWPEDELEERRHKRIRDNLRQTLSEADDEF
jgi:hypothetical protein